MLEIKNLYAGYINGQWILNGIDISIRKNEVLAVIGQNGSGKSTLAKSIMGLIPHISGTIYFNGISIIGKRTHAISDLGIGYFSQGGGIFPNLTVKENLELSLKGCNNEEKEKRWLEMRNIFDIIYGKYINKKASYLSGGEKHQLALAMVLMRNPDLLILDEPSAGLSPENIKSLYSKLEIIKSQRNRAVLIIEQNINMAIASSGNIILIADGQVKNKCKSKDLNTNSKIDDFFFDKYNKKEFYEKIQ